MYVCLPLVFMRFVCVLGGSYVGRSKAEREGTMTTERPYPSWTQLQPRPVSSLPPLYMLWLAREGEVGRLCARGGDPSVKRRSKK